MDQETYLRSCLTPFWQHVLQFERAYLERHIAGCHQVLSVGCGPAIIEADLARRGYELTGLDVSTQALDCAPDSIRTVAGRAEDMPFADSAFEAVMFIASLQFVDDYRAAIQEASRVLKPAGTLIALLLNPQSEFYQAKSHDPDSYIQKTKHTDNDAIAGAAACMFDIATEYCLGIDGETIFESDDPADAALFSLIGRKKRTNK
jgi:SAM-dependent methyltransferase